MFLSPALHPAWRRDPLSDKVFLVARRNQNRKVEVTVGDIFASWPTPVTRTSCASRRRPAPDQYPGPLLGSEQSAGVAMVAPTGRGQTYRLRLSAHQGSLSAPLGEPSGFCVVGFEAPGSQ